MLDRAIEFYGSGIPDGPSPMAAAPSTPKPVGDPLRSDRDYTLWVVGDHDRWINDFILDHDYNPTERMMVEPGSPRPAAHTTDPSLGRSLRLPILLALSILAVGVGLLVVATMNVLPWEGQADPADALGASELADLTLSSVQYIQTLTTAVFGGGILLLGQRFLGDVRERDDSHRRVLVLTGFTLLVLSLLAGFVSIELLLEAADQRLVDTKASAMRWIRILQSSFLAGGFALIGGEMALDLLRGKGIVET